MSLSLNSIEDIKSESKLDLESQLTSALRSMAAASDWPNDIVSALSINVDDDLQMVIEYPDTFSKQVDDLEYGTAEAGHPNAVIRPFTRKANDIITKYLLNVIFPKMIQRAGIF